MKLFYVLIVTLTLFVAKTTAALEPQKCCRNEENLLVNRRCVKDKSGKSPSILLTCEEKYILNPHELEEDFYNVTANATLFIPDMGSYLLREE